MRQCGSETQLSGGGLRPLDFLGSDVGETQFGRDSPIAGKWLHLDLRECRSVNLFHHTAGKPHPEMGMVTTGQARFFLLARQNEGTGFP